MVEDLRTWMRRRVPAIAWRDELLAERVDQVKQLRLQLAAEEQQVVELRDDMHRERDAHQRLRSLVTPDVAATNQGSPPSFRRHLLDLRRGTRQLSTLDRGARHPLRRIPRKLRNYRLASSHLVSVPNVLGVWGDLDELDLRGMPEAFVLKSDRGAGGRGVLPLRRVDDGSFQMVGGVQTFTQDEIIEYLRHRSLGGPFFAEEILVQPGGGELPEDIKFYMFYGEVGHVMLRRMPQHADLRQARFRFLDEAGVDLADDVAPERRIDTTIQPPEHLSDYLDIARHLSRAVALPFVRVDLYDTTRGPVFGELTRGPGGKQLFREDHDRHLGRLWDLAQFRLDLDVVAGRPLRNLHGEHPAPSLYPTGYEPPGEQHGGGEQSVLVPCRTCCVRSSGDADRVGTLNS